MVGTSQWETCYTRHFGMLNACRSPLRVNRYSGQGSETIVTSLLKDCKDHVLFPSLFHSQLLYQNDEPRIEYSYLLPNNHLSKQKQGDQQRQPAEPKPLGHRGVEVQPTQPSPIRQTYAWRLAGFTQCTHSCAGGTDFLKCQINFLDILPLLISLF